jgi:hypothetical protein
MNRSLPWLLALAGVVGAAIACGGKTREDASRSGTGGSGGGDSEVGSGGATTTAGAGGSTPLAPPGCAGVITFPDPGLEAAVRDAIAEQEVAPPVERPTGDIRSEDVAQVSRLSANGQGIYDLTGLECLRGLTGLYLGDNDISDLSPLAGLTGLNELRLDGNNISDLGPLSGLPGLGLLILDDNSVVDLTPLLSLPGFGECNDSAILNDFEECLLVTVENNPIDCAEQADNIRALEERGVVVLSDCSAG